MDRHRACRHTSYPVVAITDTTPPVISGVPEVPPVAAGDGILQPSSLRFPRLSTSLTGTSPSPRTRPDPCSS
ncbi:hypothetical protein IBTHAUMO2_470038 [Nitrosopumilaceae archaeon]|nr:hypothetical protein IBTHAUMO2_470038 [Nitrosopumilaceae archaeon]